MCLPLRYFSINHRQQLRLRRSVERDPNRHNQRHPALDLYQIEAEREVLYDCAFYHPIRQDEQHAREQTLDQVHEGLHVPVSGHHPTLREQSQELICGRLPYRHSADHQQTQPVREARGLT